MCLVCGCDVQSCKCEIKKYTNMTTVKGNNSSDKIYKSHGSGTGSDNSENPLLNHLIASKVLSFGRLNFEQLKTFRLVCSLWYALSLDQWRQSFSLRLLETESNELPIEKIGVCLQEFCQLYSRDASHSDSLFQLARKPYSRYKLINWSSSYPQRSSEYVKQETELWTSVIAPCVEYLHIENCYFPDSKQVEEKILTCENLKELTLVGNSSGICRGYKIPEAISDELPALTSLRKLTVSGAMPMQWSKLLRHAPNLESLTIKQNGSSYRTTFASFLLDLHQLEFAGRNPMNIKHLDIMEADDTFTDFVSLSSRNLRLESLSAHFEKVRPEHFMQPLLLAQARTLKILKLCRVSNRSEEPFGQFEFPYSVNMPNLTELYLWGDMVKNMNFLRYLPSLKVLYVSRDRYEKKHLLRYWGSGTSWESTPAEDLVLGQNEMLAEENANNFFMNEMETLHMDCKFTNESLTLLRRWMPNLQRVASVFNNDTLRMLCHLWPNLKDVIVMYGSNVDDNGMQNIFSLKDLEKFRLDAYCNQSKLSDALFQHGNLYKMKTSKLQAFKICVSEKMSFHAERLLQRLAPQAKIQFVRNYDTDQNHQERDCCHRMKFNSE